MKRLSQIWLGALVGVVLLVHSGCSKTEAKQPPAPQALPVQTETVSLSPVPRSDEYVATVKSRRSATIQPQVDGSLHAHSREVRGSRACGTGVDDHRSAEAGSNGQSANQYRGAEEGDLIYNQTEVERQRRLYEAGVTSKQSYDLAVQAYENSKADWEASRSATVTQQRQLAYYNLVAPFDGLVGDIPVHLGDYVSPQTVLTTVDENNDLEAYIYIPTELSSDIRMGLPVEIVTSRGELIEKTKIDFISQQVDNALQGVLVKAPIHASLDKFRNSQLVKARVVWSTAPAPKVPVLAVARIGGQPFVYVAAQGDHGTVAKQKAVVLGDTVGNDYVVTSGLNPGDKVIVSGIQFLIDGVPVHPIS